MPSYRVEKTRSKRSSSGKRGRPSLYSPSWTKKLLFLRTCGLSLNDILNVLNVQTDSECKASLRTCQHLVRKYLCNSKHRFSPLDRPQARQYVSILRNRGHGTCRKHGRHHRITSSLSRRKPENLATIVYHSSQQTLPGSAYRSKQIGERQEGETIAYTSAVQVVPGTEILCPIAGDERDRTSSGQNIDIYTISETAESLHQLHSESASDGRSITSTASRRYKLREMMKRCSLSSSTASNILSLLEKRFSLSTMTMSSRCSSSVVSTRSVDISRPSEAAARVIAKWSARSLAELRTAGNEFCHRCKTHYIGMRDIASHLSSVDVPSCDATLCNTPRLDSTSVLPILDCVLKAKLIHSFQNSLTCNTRDRDGQTLLFHIDARHFNIYGCTCSEHLGHQSHFECMISVWASYQFDFDRLDNDGRCFLHFLCSSATFNLQWIVDLLKKDSAWEYRIWHMSRIRDSAGLFLYDFVSTREDFDSLNEDILSHFRPPVAFQSGSSYTTRVCLEQDSEGNSEVHRRLVMHDTGVLTLPSLLLITSEYVSQINSYNCHGLTPLMDYLKYAVEDHQKPVDICEKVNSLIHCGIEFNARSRDGSTILHFAAKHALPELLELLIETNIRFDHCDDAGHTALTYAADAVDRSRIASASIDFAGRAMRSATILLAATQTYSAAFQESLRARPGGSR